MSQVGAGGTGVGTLSRERDPADGVRPEFVRRHPASLDPPRVRVERVRPYPRAPQLVTAGLVLWAAAAVLEGYRWLGVVAAGRLHPSPPVFAVLMVPLILLLTRPPHHASRRTAQKAAMVAGCGLVAVTVVQMVVGRTWSAHLLGAYDLAMAVVVLAAALVTGDLLGMSGGYGPS
jgi:hypothetical protein